MGSIEKRECPDLRAGKRDIAGRAKISCGTIFHRGVPYVSYKRKERPLDCCAATGVEEDKRSREARKKITIHCDSLRSDTQNEVGMYVI